MPGPFKRCFFSHLRDLRATPDSVAAGRNVIFCGKSFLEQEGTEATEKKTLFSLRTPVQIRLPFLR